MLSIEIHKRLRILGIPPDLAQQSRVRRTHQLLADDVQTMRDVVLHDVVGVDEGALTPRTVVVDVVIERLAE